MQHKRHTDAQVEKHLISEQGNIILAFDKGPNVILIITSTANHPIPKLFLIELGKLIKFFVYQCPVWKQEDCFFAVRECSRTCQLANKRFSGTGRCDYQQRSPI